ncbi:MAG: hypothetical protein KKD76_02180, partial [Verrucomicrobia bacterium]|nr:hypothetical protein [Verrucomicrobiota bacterium]
MTQPRTTVYVSYENHFDLIWRRGWERRYEFEGKIWRSYADIEEAVISRWLRLALTQGCAFTLEQSLSLRKYLERHPEQVSLFRTLSQKGRFLLHGAGEAIIDVNLCSGETVARNLASGIGYAERLLGDPVLCAYHGDGFGSCAQLPQIVRRCGLRGIIGLSYCKPDASYWRGLDGSTVLTDFSVRGGGGFHDHCYFTPCPTCRGTAVLGEAACPACDGTGLDLTNCHYPHWDWPAPSESPIATFALTSEEMLPDEDLPRRVSEQNAAQDDQRYVWGTMRMYFDHFARSLAAVDNPPADQVSSRVENNPTQTGCYVSRIKIKQRARAAEARFYAAEVLMSLAQILDNKPPAYNALQAAWLRLPLLFFHDAVTGSHNDPAYWELLDMASEVERTADAVTIESMQRRNPNVRSIVPLTGTSTVTVFNSLSFQRTEWVSLPLAPSGMAGCRVTDAAGNEAPVYADGAYDEPPLPYPNPRQPIMPVGPGCAEQRTPAIVFLARDIPSMSSATFTIAPGAPLTSQPLDAIENEHYAVYWDDRGVKSIFDKVLSQELVGGNGLHAGELILERDHGDPWGTRSLDRPRVPLGQDTRFLGARQYGQVQEVRFGGSLNNNLFGCEKIPEIRGLYWYETVRAYEGLSRVEFDIEIFWQTENQRIRVAFPTRAASDTGIYSTPYGLVKRNRYEMTETCLWSPNGDWPAAEWVGTLPAPGAAGVAVVNFGTPSARIEDGVILYSVLRSPGYGFAQSLYAWDYPVPLARMADPGFHRFRFALTSYKDEPVAEGVLDQAFSMTTPMSAWQGSASVRGFTVEPSGVYLTALKPTFDGDGWALRVVEYAGRAIEATIG